MERKIFKKLVSMEDALKILYSHYTPKPLGIEEVPLERALNRVLAEDVYSDVDVPPFDRATVDGFAVIASDTFHAHENRPVTLRYGGTVDAGKVPKIKVVPGVAVEIGTGAVIPKGANAVVMVEHTSREGDFVKIYRSVAPGHNIQFAGSDVMKGEFVLRKNTILTPHEIGVLAAVGIAKVKVYRKPKIALISTGDEIAEPGETLEYGKIYDINRFTITSHLIEDGAEPTFIGVARDNPDEISSLIKKGLEVADVVISSGSTSAGVRDILYNLINKLGKPGILVHGIKTKPGKPTIIALLNGKPFFGLPGYPTSALMIYKSIVSPIIRKLSGYPTIKRRKSVKAIIKSPIYAETGKTNLVPVSLIYDSKGQLIAFPTPGGSGSIMKLANADGYIKIPETINFLEENSEVEVFLFSEDFEPPDLFIIGSHCLGLDLILSLMIRRNPNLKFRVVNTGSYGGLMSVLRDEADLAGMHILDEKTNEYNIPVIKHLKVEEKVVFVKGYIRRQGLVVQKGNPKGIKSIEDLLRDDVSFINRISGSGTRILLDILLKKIALEKNIPFNELIKKIDGYHVEVRTHNAVGAAVKSGKFDVGLAIEPIAHMYELEFIPITNEYYDFVISKSRFEKEAIQQFLEVLKSEEFQKTLSKSLPGLKPYEDTGRIINLI